MTNIPAGQLQGMQLSGGWTVLEQVTRKKTSTGGHFSVGYRVQHSSGKTAFLKALDFSSAQQTADPLRTLEAMLRAYNFERDLLEKCRDKKLARVMTPIGDGSVNVNGYGIVGTVHYMIFELAKGDVRDVMGDLVTFDAAFCLRSLHNVAVGLQQLHKHGIAHQDLKPSNVLVADDSTSKVGDLGRSADRAKASDVDVLPVPGDRGYAPPDLFYRKHGAAEFDDRFLIDLYLLGSLVFFFFSGVSAKHALMGKLHGVAALSNTSFDADLPHLQHAFQQTLEDLKLELSKIFHEKTATELVECAKCLCEPDPRLRGDPKWRGSVVPVRDLQRFVAKFDRLARHHSMAGR